jgi:hypothetical protein
MAAHAGAQWFYENMVDSGQYQLVETIIGFRGCRRWHRDNEFPLGKELALRERASFAQA